MNDKRLPRWLITAAPLLLTLASTSLILLAIGANPLAAYGQLLSGAFGSVRKFGDIAVGGVPLLLCSAGMLVTFAAGLWNIGVEGQVVVGAIATTWAVRTLDLPAPLMLPVTLVAGAAGGMLWGLLAGVIRTFGNVNEIFVGLGLNYAAIAWTNYLVLGPWRNPEGATMSGTETFPKNAWMPLLGNTRASLVSILVAAAAIVIVWILLRDTHWGLRLKAVGLNPKSAYRMGIPTSRVMLSGFAVCGVMAGIAGSLQTTAIYHRLIPSISSGYGYMAQLVVLLSGLRAAWVPAIVFFFAAIRVGSPRLELRMQLDSSLGGVLQSTMVLFFILVKGWAADGLGRTADGSAGSGDSPARAADGPNTIEEATDAE